MKNLVHEACRVVLENLRDEYDDWKDDYIDGVKISYDMPYNRIILFRLAMWVIINHFGCKKMDPVLLNILKKYGGLVIINNTHLSLNFSGNRVSIDYALSSVPSKKAVKFKCIPFMRDSEKNLYCSKENGEVVHWNSKTGRFTKITDSLFEFFKTLE